MLPLLQIDAEVSSQEDSMANMTAGCKGFMAAKVKAKATLRVWLLKTISNHLYLVLMATTGSILAAIEAGIIPEMMPRIIQILMARVTILGAIKIGNGKILVSARDNNQTRNKPTSPPMIHKNALSIKNSVRMVLRLAPSAFFKPI
jgi:hypothetical protein